MNERFRKLAAELANAFVNTDFETCPEWQRQDVLTSIAEIERLCENVRETIADYSKPDGFEGVRNES